MTERTLYWLAGLLEGEGSFMAGPPSTPNQPRIAINMTDRDVIERVGEVFGVRHVHTRRQPGRNWKDCYAVTLRGSRAVALMRTLRPLMGVRRQAQIDRALASYDVRGTGNHSRRLTPGDVYTIRQTAGVVSVAETARRFNVCRTTVHRIRTGRAWRSLP